MAAFGGSEHDTSAATKIPCFSGSVPPRSRDGSMRLSRGAGAGGEDAVRTDGLAGCVDACRSWQAVRASTEASATQIVLGVISNPLWPARQDRALQQAAPDQRPKMD